MRNKSLFLLMACVCGTIAAVGVSQWMQANQGKSARTVEIYVTSQEIGELEEITPEKLQLEQWPLDKVPANAITDIKELEGKYAKHTLYAGEAVVPMKLVGSQDHYPDGFTVVTLKADRNTSISLLSHGDRVDVSAYFSKDDFFPYTTTKVILSGVRVYAIDGEKKKPEEEEPRRRSPPREVSLVIRKADQEAWSYATRQGDVELNLGGKADYETAGKGYTRSEKADEFLTWLQGLRDEQTAKNAPEIPEQTAAPVQEQVATPAPAPGPKKNTWRITKMVGNRMIVYEFTEGDPTPRVIADTGEAEITDPAETITESDDTTPSPDEDSLNGPDSPFFEPPTDDIPSFGPGNGRF